ncbi:MAG: hypothetical protein LUB83_02730, partial [Prevotellaceae bacterium]|nr:hypothetical protein [Prevotellaceae bacterium]
VFYLFVKVGVLNQSFMTQKGIFSCHLKKYPFVSMNVISHHLHLGRKNKMYIIMPVEIIEQTTYCGRYF